MNDEKADVDKILKELGTSQSGLTEEEAQKRIEQYGYNEMQEKKGKQSHQVSQKNFGRLFPGCWRPP